MQGNGLELLLDPPGQLSFPSIELRIQRHLRTGKPLAQGRLSCFVKGGPNKSFEIRPCVSYSQNNRKLSAIFLVCSTTYGTLTIVWSYTAGSG